MPPLLLSACAALPDWLRDVPVLGIHLSIANFLNSYGYLAVFLFIGIENLGVPFPGETMLVAASVYAAQACGLQEPYVILVCILGSVVGSTTGYWIGRTGGRGVLRKLHVSEKHLGPAEAYFERYGGATVFFGRFLAVLRAWAAFLAGLNHMPAGRFLVYNTVGAVIWSTAFGMLGFILGKHLNQLQRVLTALGTGGAIVVGIVVVVAIGTFWFRRRRRINVVLAHVEQTASAGREQGTEDPVQEGGTRATAQPALPHTLAAQHASLLQPQTEEQVPLHEGRSSGPLQPSARADVR
jgi:membrane protein DedA with SNARE-associated domain